MTREEVTRLAEQAKILVVGDAAFRLCQLVVAAERQACALIAEDYWGEGNVDMAVAEIAAEIRARGEK
jgi:hypothetical protein